MANSNRKSSRKNVSQKERKGDTGRTSNQGRKLSSGGRKETDNQGRPRGNNPQSGERTGAQGLNM